MNARGGQSRFNGIVRTLDGRAQKSHSIRQIGYLKSSCPENCVLGCRFNHSVARRSNLNRKTLMPLPDGPKSPKIWQMLHWIIMPFSFMQACNDRYGDCFTAGIGEKLSPVVFFSNPQALQVILTSDDSELFDSPGELNALFE